MTYNDWSELEINYKGNHDYLDATSRLTVLTLYLVWPCLADTYYVLTSDILQHPY